MFGPSVRLWLRQSLPRDPLQHSAMLLRTCWQMLTSPTQKEASALYCRHAMQQALFTLLAGCEGVSSGSVTLFVSCEATAVTRGRGCREDAFQGVWGQPTWLHRWMTVRPWAMCLLGAFCSGRAAVLKSTGTSDAYKEGRPFIKLCLISVRLRILPCSLNLQCQVMSNWPLSNLITDYSLTVNTCARCRHNELMTLDDIAS